MLAEVELTGGSLMYGPGDVRFNHPEAEIVHRLQDCRPERWIEPPVMHCSRIDRFQLAVHDQSVAAKLYRRRSSHAVVSLFMQVIVRRVSLNMFAAGD